MSDSNLSEQDSSGASHDERFSALFAQLVMQQANLAMLLMGKVPHPDTGKVVKDTDAAKLFIDELEMIEVKTKGNLTKDEAALLKQSLMTLRLSFVEAVESPAPAPEPPPSAPESKAAPGQPSTPAQPAAAAPATPREESPKKFSKKY
jgi:hypothetical protein